jgi:hypothetical protein
MVTSRQILVELFRDDPVYIKYYMNVTRTVLLGILPFAALIFFNIKIYMRFLVTRGRYARPNSHNSSQVKTPFPINIDNLALFDTRVTFYDFSFER